MPPFFLKKYCYCINYRWNIWTIMGINATLSKFSLRGVLQRFIIPTAIRRRRKALQLGRRGEDAAALFLQYAGYDILLRNWRPPRGHSEIDIIARSPDGVMCFVEVKCRRMRGNDTAQRPIDAVNGEKQRQLHRAADAYLRSVGRFCFKFRFDVIEVWASRGVPCRLRHWSGAFGESSRMHKDL